MVTGVEAVQEVENDGEGELGIAGLRLGTANHRATPRRWWYLPLKTASEWLVAFVLLVATSPLLVFLAILVKLTSHGPAFYAQTRLGRHGKRYRIFKLRTMIHNAEARTGAVWAAKNDDRVTGLGRILRATHLDEMPQLWNVLLGDMSLIGPRPERPEIALGLERRLPAYRLRLAVRPGITGLAQMLVPADDPEDRGLNCVKQKLAHDLYYVREVSVFLDLRVALSTPCFFAAAAIDGLRRRLLRPCGAAMAKELAGSLLSSTEAAALEMPLVQRRSELARANPYVLECQS